MDENKKLNEFDVIVEEAFKIKVRERIIRLKKELSLDLERKNIEQFRIGKSTVVFEYIVPLIREKPSAAAPES